MVNIIRSAHFNNGTQTTMEVPFDTLPTLASLVFVHGPDIHNIRSIYPACVEPDLQDALLDLIQRGYSVKSDGLWDRVHRAKGVVLAFDTSGNLVGCAAVRRDQRPYRQKVRDTFGAQVNADAAYSINWVRGRDEFKSVPFFELVINTALALLDTNRPPCYVTVTGTERPAYMEALINSGFIAYEPVSERTPLAHLRLYVLPAENNETTNTRSLESLGDDFDSPCEETCAEPMCEAMPSEIQQDESPREDW